MRWDLLRLFGCLAAGIACLGAIAAEAPGGAITVELTLRAGSGPPRHRTLQIDLDTPFTLHDGSGARRWDIEAVAHEVEPGEYELDARLRCGGVETRREHVRSVGRDAVAMFAAQSDACARRALAVEMRVQRVRAEEDGMAPFFRMRYKICWDAVGHPTEITFLEALPKKYAEAADSVAASLRTWTFNTNGRDPSCERVDIIVN